MKGMTFLFTVAAAALGATVAVYGPWAFRKIKSLVA